jgi:hypothetical protein
MKCVAHLQGTFGNMEAAGVARMEDTQAVYLAIKCLGPDGAGEAWAQARWLYHIIQAIEDVAGKKAIETETELSADQKADVVQRVKQAAKSTCVQKM